MSTFPQRQAVGEAIEMAHDFAVANHLTADRATYVDIREIPDDSGNLGVVLHTTDPAGVEVRVQVLAYPSGELSDARGYPNVWAAA